MEPRIWLRGGCSEDRISLVQGQMTQQEDVVSRLDINPELTDDQRARLTALLTEFKNCFAANPKKPNLVKNGEHKIEVKASATPIKAKRFRMSPQQEEEVRKQADDVAEEWDSTTLNITLGK